VHDLGRPEGRWRQWRALAPALRRHGPFDVIHGYWVDPGGLLAAIAGRRLGVPSVVTCDSGEFVSLPEIDYGLQRTTRGRSVVRLACGLARRLHVATDYMAARARDHGYSPITIPIGIPVDAGAPTARRESDPKRLLQVASLNRVKDQGLLLRALAIVRQRADVHLDLVGEDTLGGELQRDASTLGLTEAVTFHGFVRHADLGRFYRSADLYVQTSRHEAAGVSVLEAASYGLPVIGTGVGYISDWAHEAAVAVAPADPDTLAAAIVRLLEHPAERRTIAANAYRWAAAHDADWTARTLSDLYASLARRSAAGDSESEHTQR
jgi:glycosyltransferase involved in cell wall biosynthesis